MELQDYYDAWQVAICRTRIMLESGTAAAYRDALAEEEYQRALYYRYLAAATVLHGSAKS
jgi:hypothetical protein